jgi:hypothetical protein
MAKWNFSSVGRTSRQNSPEPAKPGAPRLISIDELKIKYGKLVVRKANSTVKRQVYDELNVELTVLHNSRDHIQPKVRSGRGSYGRYAAKGGATEICFRKDRHKAVSRPSGFGRYWCRR